MAKKSKIVDEGLNKKTRFVSLFSGAMGLDLGLEKAGLEAALCLENDPAAVATIKKNKPSLPIISESIVHVDGAEIKKASALKEVELVAGGPPCQAFSVFGSRLGLQDSRGQLIFEYLRVVDELRPKVFLMENVRGLLSMSVVPKKHQKGLPESKRHLAEPGSLLKELLKEFGKIGYRVDCFVVNAVNYGAPQIRERIILIGNRYGLLADFPSPQYSNRKEDGLPPFKTLGDVIGGDFVDPDSEVMNFSPRKLKYLSMIPEGGNWRSLAIHIQKESMGKSWYLKGGRSAYWRKLSLSFPSPTVVTMPNHAGTSMCHPKELRAISVGEAMAIQEFPLDWKLCGSVTEKFRQVGNAVPVRLGTVAGETILRLLKRIDRMEEEPLQAPQYRIIHLRPHVRTRQFWKDGQVYTGDTSYYDEDDDQLPLFKEAC
ncbi:MAG: DNA cytosine methyltransferase [Alphaproteobacteria bacterium]|nr:DNA cytosine methyltransferase [Alphaproteobacteria bacterium]